MKQFNIPFSPPDISEAEVELVADWRMRGTDTAMRRTRLGGLKDTRSSTDTH